MNTIVIIIIIIIIIIIGKIPFMLLFYHSYNFLNSNCLLATSKKGQAYSVCNYEQTHVEYTACSSISYKGPHILDKLATHRYDVVNKPFLYLFNHAV